MTVQVDHDTIEIIKLSDMFLTISPFSNNKTFIPIDFLGIDLSQIVISDLLDDVLDQIRVRFSVNISKTNAYVEDSGKYEAKKRLVGYEIELQKDRTMKVMTLKQHHYLRTVDLVEYILNLALNEIFNTVQKGDNNWFELQRRLKVQENDLQRQVKPGLLEKYNYIEDVEPRILMKSAYKEI